MFDIVGLLKILSSLWPFVREHLFNNKKVLRHFQNSPTNLLVTLMHVAAGAMAFNLVVAMSRIEATQRELEREIHESVSRKGALEATLKNHADEIDRLSRLLHLRDNEVQHLQRLLRYNDIQPDPDQE